MFKKVFVHFDLFHLCQRYDNLYLLEQYLCQLALKARCHIATTAIFDIQHFFSYLFHIIGEVHRPSELKIVMLGSRFSGKSSAGNTILGSEAFSLTSSSGCVKHQGKVGNRQITLIEAPGWLRSLCVAEPYTYYTFIVKEIIRSITLCAPGPYAVLLVVQADTSFTEDVRRTLEEHLRLLHERIWNYAMVLFTCGDWLGDWTIEEHIESEGKALQWLVEACGNRYHILNNQDHGKGAQVMELLDKIEEIVAGNSRYLQVPKSPPPRIRGKHEPRHIRTDSSQRDVENQNKDDSTNKDDTVDETMPVFTDKRKNYKLSDLHIHKAHSMQHSHPTSKMV